MCQLQPLSKRQILDSSKLKEFADDNFKVDENSRKFSKWMENPLGKGGIARYEQFLLYPQCFQRLILQTHKNQGLFGKGLKKQDNLLDHQNLDPTQKGLIRAKSWYHFLTCSQLFKVGIILKAFGNFPLR